jgi:sterol 3beta-glucosyltransferase
MRRVGETITLFAFGSEGDTRPIVALGHGLRSRGYEVRVLAARRYRPLVARAGLTHYELEYDPLEMLGSEAGKETLSSRNPVSLIRNFRRVIGQHVENFLDQALEAATGADAILAPASGFAGYHIGEYLDVPTALLHLQPGQPTRTAANPIIAAGRSLSGPVNRVTYEAIEQVSWQVVSPIINRWRDRRLGLAPMPRTGPFRVARRERILILCGYSPAVVPVPRDWPPHVHVTGYWTLASDDRPSQVVEDFVTTGPPPVYVGFGSMVPPDPEGVAKAIGGALRDTGTRAVVVGEAPAPEGDGAGGPAGATPAVSCMVAQVAEHADDVLAVPSTPHRWLFPRSAAVVHHGGAGTTAAALMAGVPEVICPFFADQPFWAARAADLGVATTPLPIKKLTADDLAHRIRQAVEDPGMRERARALARHLAAEDGVARACDVIEQWLPTAEPPGGRRIKHAAAR